MDIRVRLFAGQRERAGTDEVLVVGLDPGANGVTVADVRRALAMQFPALGDLDGVAGVIGTAYAPPEREVVAGEVLAFLPPVSGGAPEPDQQPADDLLLRGLFELCAEPLDPGALHTRLVHPSAGAVVLFTGTTRATNRGLDVERLDYEAFHEMAGPEMARIFTDCRAQFGDGGDAPVPGDHLTQPGARILRMLCVHRIGTVGVAEPSVVVGVSSPHRDTAFRAARFLIDALKERLPVWKKEVYGDGHSWIGERS